MHIGQNGVFDCKPSSSCHPRLPLHISSLYFLCPPFIRLTNGLLVSFPFPIYPIFFSFVLLPFILLFSNYHFSGAFTSVSFGPRSHSYPTSEGRGNGRGGIRSLSLPSRATFVWGCYASLERRYLRSLRSCLWGHWVWRPWRDYAA